MSGASQVPSALSDAIERHARAIAGTRRGGARESDREFAGLLTMLSAWIARLIRQYGLGDVREDAQQAAAIGVHRALETFDPAKARFVTHATWQIRGELQSLRHRVRLDQRRSAAGATTLSLEALPAEFEIIDDSARKRTERGASDTMAGAMLGQLLAHIGAPTEERLLVTEHIFDAAVHPTERLRSPEQRRQIIRRTMRNCAKALAS